MIHRIRESASHGHRRGLRGYRASVDTVRCRTRGCGGRETLRRAGIPTSPKGMPKGIPACVQREGRAAEGTHLGVHVRDVGGDAGCAHDVIERQACDGRVHLHEHGQALADAARGAHHAHLALHGTGGHGTRARHHGGCDLREERGHPGKWVRQVVPHATQLTDEAHAAAQPGALMQARGCTSGVAHAHAHTCSPLRSGAPRGQRYGDSKVHRLLHLHHGEAQRPPRARDDQWTDAAGLLQHARRVP